jgi:hypothetical protein
MTDISSLPSITASCFGDGRNSDNFDFDAHSGEFGYRLIVSGVPETDKVTFNISHDKVGHDTRWYSNCCDGYPVPNAYTGKHTAGHKIYISGAKYTGSGDPKGFTVSVEKLDTKPADLIFAWW